MALLLHLTDIHIGDKQSTDDHKAGGAIGYPERHQRFTTYCSTLKSLGKQLEAESRILDAVIVSGDITVRNQEDGFKLFKDLIESLGSAKPLNNNVVVIPGNHDVQWGVKDFKKKYKHFLKYIRSEGYRTPYLDSIDNPSISDNFILNFPLE